MLKSIKGWEWLLIVVTCLIMFFHNSIIQVIKEMAVTDATSDVAGRQKGKRGWFRNLIQAIVGELPGGGVINTIWNHIWP